MLNQVAIVGRLVERPIIEENKNGRKVSELTLAVQRSYKNAEGVYETDFIKRTLWNGIAENTVEYCNKGDVIGVKGRLQCLSGNELQLIAEKVSFLSSGKTKKGEEK